MNYLVSLLTICTIIVLYIHIVHQLKTSDDLELFELDTPSKNKLEEVCDLRQPLLFSYNEEHINQCILSKCMEYKAFDIVIYDSNYNPFQSSLEKAMKLIEDNKYISLHNSTFLNETMMYRYYSETDEYLRPPMVSSITYDILFGSVDCNTQLEYSTHYRNYLYVTEGSVNIKLTPPRNSKYLDVKKNYATETYYSTIDVWKHIPEKIKFLEIKVNKGQMLFIPAYWWYSIQFEKDACVCTLQYKTVMNIVATLPDLFMGILQRQNTKTKLKINQTYVPAPTSSELVSRTSEAPGGPL
jgi:hypothetical protein